jgi:hypothetical protein
MEFKMKLYNFLLYVVIFMTQNVYADTNRSTCLSGKYPALCKHELLKSSELSQVNAAELRENLKICLDGKYPALCRHDKLKGEEITHVNAAELRENLKICLDGKYPALCRHDKLKGEEITHVNAAEKIKNKEIPQTQRVYKRAYVGSCESGHWIESVSNDGEIVKLEDGSVWQIDAGDTVDTILWLPTTDVVSCGDKLINIEDNETVGSIRLR